MCVRSFQTFNFNSAQLQLTFVCFPIIIVQITHNYSAAIYIMFNIAEKKPNCFLRSEIHVRTRGRCQTDTNYHLRDVLFKLGLVRLCEKRLCRRSVNRQMVLTGRVLNRFRDGNRLQFWTVFWTLE
jgi:hypothetical protein